MDVVLHIGHAAGEADVFLTVVGVALTIVGVGLALMALWQSLHPRSAANMDAGVREQVPRRRRRRLLDEDVD
jgi:hypothetical protein